MRTQTHTYTHDMPERSGYDLQNYYIYIYATHTDTHRFLLFEAVKHVTRSVNEIHAISFTDRRN